MLRKILGRLLLVVYIAAILYLCFSRMDAKFLAGSWLGIPKDRLAHFAMFLPFAFLMYLSFHRSTRRWWTLLLFLLLVLVIGAALGAGIEWVQEGLDYRTADIGDFVADCAGVAAGAVFTFIWGAIFRNW
ncbi:MAG: VanZ family protein [Bacteroidales bacterium]|nr:VanZ family protein [Bacteroidales bacterium]